QNGHAGCSAVRGEYLFRDASHVSRFLHPAGNRFTELRQAFRRRVTEHAITNVTHKLFLDRGADREVRIGRSEWYHIGRLLCPPHVKRTFAKKIKPDNVVGKWTKLRMVRFRYWQQNSAADFRGKEMTGQFSSLGYIGRALLAALR